MGKNRLVGGDYLLDLTPITISKSVDGTTKTNITNADVLAQLTNLKRFIANPQMIKPVWVKFVNAVNSDIVVVRGQLSVVDASEFEIDIFISGYTLKLFIEFTQVELVDHTLIDDWYIETNDAKYLFTSDAQDIGAIIGTGEIENAKPIYCHPIAFIDTTGTQPKRLTALIFNNDSTPFTLTTFKEWLDNLATSTENKAKLLVSGGFKKDDSNIGIASYITKDNADIYYIIGINIADGTSVNISSSTFTTVFPSSTVFEDGVNKIN